MAVLSMAAYECMGELSLLSRQAVKAVCISRLGKVIVVITLT